jgi:hypothetical protein
VLRRLTVSLATLMLLACGGSSSNTSLPRLSVSFARTPVPLALGSYCWQTVNSGHCVDGGSIQSEIVARGLDAVRVLPASAGQITFDRAPKTLSLSAGPDEDHLEPVPVSGNSFRSPATAGRYAFRLTGRWHEGDASWVFVVTVTPA